MMISGTKRFLAVVTGILFACFLTACRSVPEFTSQEAQTKFDSIQTQPKSVRMVHFVMQSDSFGQKHTTQMWIDRSGKFRSINQEKSSRQDTSVVWDGSAAFMAAGKSSWKVNTELNAERMGYGITFPFFRKDDVKSVSLIPSDDPKTFRLALTSMSKQYKDLKIAVEKKTGYIREASWTVSWLNNTTMQLRCEFLDYRNKDGFFYPQTIRMFLGKGGVPVISKIKDIQLNPTVPAQIFQPEYIPDFPQKNSTNKE